MNVKEFYKGKTILISGTTGFVGKVVLEKLLRSIPDIKRIYLMVRPKKTQSPEQRMLNGIFSSEIFTRLWKEQPDLKSRIVEKVRPIAGDLVVKELGISPSDRAMLVEELDIIINVAASTNFDDPLLDALQINYFGCQRMLQLATDCKKVDTYTHVSTAYVNSNRPNSTIEEKVYDLPNGQDPEDLVRDILNMNPQQVSENEKAIIGAYPNTYTFTKSMAERMLKKRHGDLKVSIVRPSIVISCQDEPCLGWTETISAAGGLVFAVANGLLNFIKTKPHILIDIIPCDFVSNQIIVACAYTSIQEKGAFNVVHSASSHSNPLTVKQFAAVCTAFFQTNPFHRQLFSPWVKLTPGDLNFKAHLKVYQELPTAMMDLYSRTPYLGSKELRAQVKMLKQV